MNDTIIKSVTLDEIDCKEIKTAKNNNQYCSVGIKVGGKWYNGLIWGDNIETASKWKLGDKIMLAFFQEEWKGKMMSKFKLPTKTDLIYHEIDAIKREIFLIKEHINLK